VASPARGLAWLLKANLPQQGLSSLSAMAFTLASLVSNADDAAAADKAGRDHCKYFLPASETFFVCIVFLAL